MDKIKGIIFLLESLVNTGKKQWMSNNISIDKSEALSLINKLTEAVDAYENEEKQSTTYHANDIDMRVQNTAFLDTKKEVLKLKQDANEYADAILSRLQLLVTKLQKNVIKIEKNITEGRHLIEEKQLANMKGDDHEIQ
ncbi:MAG: hypothetical protein ISQ13_00770 [Candidatus Margulisbacteria bacterium]|jgi:hypothetical protein|nr:hypothetical protein [Candidatus Margulisiibacteriota bacterium]|tara:strand:- start:167 stop:583 length:417 start_codon:yes stop_codon:yes gene_type:complete